MCDVLGGPHSIAAIESQDLVGFINARGYAQWPNQLFKD
jgi:hypothetical protein